MINNVVLVGRLTRDAELRYTQVQLVYVTEVVASNFQLLESRNSQQNTQGHQDHHGGYQQQGYSNQGSSFQNGNNQGNNFQNGNSYGQLPDFTRDNNPFGRPTNPLDISDDDLPFYRKGIF